MALNIKWIVIVFILFLSTSGCSKIVCNQPYIKVGNQCCLDQNSDSICDSDESLIDNKINEENGVCEMCLQIPAGEERDACQVELCYK